MSKATIGEIKGELFGEHDVSEERLVELRNDTRKGVQSLLKAWNKEKEAERKQRERFEEMSVFEKSLRERGLRYYCGTDEVGRGTICGPVVASAVMLPEEFYLPGLDDSKKLSEKKREVYFDYIKRNALSIGVGIASSTEIDEMNIYQASKVAMKRAVEDLDKQPEYLLVDAMEIPLPIKQESIIKGDSKSISIAAASIVAKVVRDRMMKDLGEEYPQYGFERHMGYGTSEHIAAIDKYGVIREHRQSFAPVRERMGFI